MIYLATRKPAFLFTTWSSLRPLVASVRAFLRKSNINRSHSNSYASPKQKARGWWLRSLCTRTSSGPVSSSETRATCTSCNITIAGQFHSTNCLDRLEIPFVLNDCPAFCPVSLVAARALADDAFEPSVDSVQTLLTRPIFQGTRCVELRWKDGFSDRLLFPLGYTQFWKIWRRTLEVAGFPESIRPYALRVGAGARLDSTSGHPFPLWLVSRYFDQLH